MSEIIRFNGVSKKFGKVVAVNSVDLSIENGEIHSIIGENGAGKTTLMRLLYGMYKPNSGKIFVRGKEVNFSSPKDAIDNEIGMVHQNFMLIDDFTVYENVVLGSEPHHLIYFDREKAKRKVEKLAKAYNIEIDVNDFIDSLSVGFQQKVEILKLLYRNAEILIFDEPTAVLTYQESKALFDTIRKFKAAGKTVIFISHKLKEVKEISDRVSVMRNGKLLDTLKNENLSEVELSKMIAGREIKNLTTVSLKKGETILEIDNLTAMGDKGIPAVKGLSLNVSRGEVLGIAGVVGNGQSELEEAIAGMRKITSGQIKFKGIDITKMSVRKRRELGMGYIPEDRIRTGLAPLASILENIIMGHQNEKEFSARLDFMRRRRAKRFANRLVNEYKIVCKSIDEQVGTLSGGNMQKVVIAREFAHDVDLLVVSQPTRGVDVGGIEFIHKGILAMKKSGKAVLLISSDLDEILQLSDRIIVMYEGQIVHSTSAKNADVQKIGLAMLGMRS